MTVDANWGQELAPLDVHTSPAEVPGAQLPSPGDLLGFVENLIEGIIREVVRAVVGIVLPGDASGQLSDWASGIAGTLLSIPGEIIARVQLLIDTLLSALTKIPVIGGTLEDLFEMLHLIPADSVQGAAGGGNMFESIFGIIDSIIGGLVGRPGATGGSLAVLTDAAGEVGANAYLGGEAWRITNMVNNTPVARGFMPTGRANYAWETCNTYVASTQAAALSVSLPILQAMPIGVTSFYGYGTSGMTALYINIRKVNPLTGVRDLVYHSPNGISELAIGTSSDDADFFFDEMASKIAAEATDTYYAEMVPVGGTLYVRGISFSDNVKDHPTAPAPCTGTTVDYSVSPNSPAPSLSKATAGPGMPWVEYAVEKGAVNDHREPRKFTFDFDGETIPIPSWCNRVDLIALGEGGDGHASGLAGFVGNPGYPGKFMAITLVRGVDFSDDETFITFNALTDGSAKLSIPGHDVTAPPGADGPSISFGITPVGHGPGVLEYNGQTYSGGVDQKSPGGAGTDPGGGGNGGKGLLGQAGGKGGKPAGWVCFRQVEVPDEASTGDTTPPTAPTVVLVDATYSTLTVKATGGTD